MGARFERLAEQAMRFLRAIKKRYQIWRSQDGYCAICGEFLDENFHIDHVKAYAKGGKTHFPNLQAVCPKCNLSKGDR
jgi:5-methylcytosine-specific restriction endonuclease McrA